MRNRHWSEEEIRKFSPEKIFQKLLDFGIETNPEEFIERFQYTRQSPGFCVQPSAEPKVSIFFTSNQSSSSK